MWMNLRSIPGYLCGTPVQEVGMGPGGRAWPVFIGSLLLQRLCMSACTFSRVGRAHSEVCISDSHVSRLVYGCWMSRTVKLGA